jgi:hypothetical protein
MMFACVDGPEFDAHQVNFAELSDRLTAYRGHEAAAREMRKEAKAAGADFPDASGACASSPPAATGACAIDERGNPQ